jgi:hypothetical protein
MDIDISNNNYLSDMVAVWGLLLCTHVDLNMKNKKRKRRRFKVRPMNRMRHTVGQYEYLSSLRGKNLIKHKATMEDTERKDLPLSLDFKST